MSDGVAKGAPLVLVGAFFIFVVVMMAGERMGEVRLGAGSAEWPAVEGRVVRSTIVRHTTAGSRPRRADLEFAYEYAVEGATYDGTRASFTAVELDRITREYPVGATVPVYYDPEDPSVAVVEPGVELGAVIWSVLPLIAFGAIGLSLSGWGVYRVFDS